MPREEPFSYNVLHDQEFRLFKLDNVQENIDEAPLTGLILSVRHPCHSRASWKTGKGNVANWSDVRFIERDGAEYGYDALSYCWGEESQEFPLQLRATGKIYRKKKLCSDDIETAGGLLHISRNLRDFLIQARRQHYDRYIWIDSICIDQQNVEEKSQQISMMSEIYKEARNMYVWLGIASQTEKGALQIMPAVTRILRKAHNKGLDLLPELPSSFTEFDLPDPSHPVWRAFGDLMSRSWFTRLWTLQEVVLPRSEKIVIMCGDIKCEWGILGEFALTIFCGYRYRLGNWMTTGRAELETTRLNGFRALTMVYQCRQQLKTFMFGNSLEFLLAASAGRMASDPVDNVFGMLGLMSTGMLKKIKIDVSLPVHEVYLTFARFYIRNETQECLLNHTSGRARRSDLPSWCPNFGSVAETLPLYSRWSDGIFIADDSVRLQQYCAGLTGTGKWEIPTIDNYVSAAIINPLRLRAPTDGCYDTKNPRQISLLPDLTHIRAAGFTIDVVREVIEYNDCIQDFSLNLDSIRDTVAWEAASRQLTERTLGISEDTLEQYWRALIGNMTGIVDDAKADARNIAWDRNNEVSRLDNYNMWRIYMQECIGQGFSTSYMTSLDDTTRNFCQQVLRIFKERCFFSTRNGRIGVGPRNIKPDDEVCIFFYCPTPYIVRRAEPVNEFVGEAYVHGIMYGEALDMFDNGELRETQYILG